MFKSAIIEDGKAILSQKFATVFKDYQEYSSDLLEIPFNSIHDYLHGVEDISK